MSVDNIIVKDNLVVCDKYGIGTVKDVYNQEFKGEDTEYVHIYFDHMEMDYRGPLHNLKYREINKPTAIKKIFKADIIDKVRELVSLNFNVQQSRMTAMMEEGTVEDVVFLLRYLTAKKENSVMNSLCAYDDNMYKKCMTNLAAELSVGGSKEYQECIQELKKLLKKNHISIKIQDEEMFDIDELDEEL